MIIEGNYSDDGYALVRGLVTRDVCRAFMALLKRDLGPGPVQIAQGDVSPILVRNSHEIYGNDYPPMQTFLSMPLRGHGGTVVGVLALSSDVDSDFGETALSTLKVVEGPAALVIDAARHAAVR